jgi:uncharacterized membrane protein YidH (DUF202 family)
LSSPFDSGLQAERTSLSWMRSALSLAIAGALTVRITMPELGLLAVIIGLLGVTLAMGAISIASFRYRRSVRQLYATGNLNTDGRLLALSSASALAIGLLVSLFVVGRLAEW